MLPERNPLNVDCMPKVTKEEALWYHAQGRPGKIEVVPTKPSSTQSDLSLAYSPGVAEPCLEIEKDPENAYKYTAKGNLVAVISNGTAVLGLGDIGALAGKPVMEGKGLLFKVFADIDVFDIEVDQTDVDAFVETVKAIAPTFGGINLEDIKSPECFAIEDRLKKELSIPVMHDDQHGTAIISGAALLNGLEIAGKKIDEVRIVVNGAGASAISCSRLYKLLGVPAGHIYMCDSKGVLHTSRSDMNAMKLEFATSDPVHTLQEAIRGADVFLGLSKGNVLSGEMVRSMASNPIVFALANPNPEISYEEAMASRPDIIFATGRSDHPNQVNNVLGFPYIFRGALDVRSTCINEEMKIAAVRAISALAKEPVPDVVASVYKKKDMSFGREYIIPKPVDPRLITRISMAVARAAMESGVARKPVTDWDGYAFELEQRLGHSNEMMRMIRTKAKANPRRVVLSHGSTLRTLQGAQAVLNHGLAHPILVGNYEKIHRIAAENNIDLEGMQVVDPWCEVNRETRERYAAIFYEKRQRKGTSYSDALEKMKLREYFSLMMVEAGDADGVIMTYSNNYIDSLRPVLQVIGVNNQARHVAGMHMLMTRSGPIFLADVSVNVNPDSNTLVQTALLVADAVRTYNIEPRIAMLSFSNFGNIAEGSPTKVAAAVEYLHQNYPQLLVDGEMQADIALDGRLRAEKFPFNKLGDQPANVYIFPCLSSGNILSKFMEKLGNLESIGPILLGLEKPVHVLPEESSVRDIMNMASIISISGE